jgi:predicted AAA+ superfamily ATPase
MDILRKLEEEALRLASDYPVLGIIGPRQCGKTTLAKKMMGKLSKASIYLDLENDDDLSKLSEPGIFLQQYWDQCVVIDEVQRMPKLFALLRSLVDQHRIPGRFILLGSSSPVLIRESSESLAGRIAYLELTPFRLDEVNGNYTWKQLWCRGGFPLSFLADDDQKSFEWRQFFLQSYIERDIPMLGLAADPIVIKRFLKMLAAFHGNLWNTENLSRSLGIHSQTVNKYVNFLENAFLVYRLQPFSTNISKRLVKSPKIYIRDSGIMHFLNNLVTVDDLWNSTLLGNSWEGFAIMQIHSVVRNIAELYFYRTHQGAECDLVIVKGNVVKSCIEIKFTSSPKISKGFFISTEDLHSDKNYIIIPGEENYPISKNAVVNGLDFFLTKTLTELI